MIKTPRFPRPGETIKGHGFFKTFGGKGANQAVAAAKLGAEVALVGCIGGDEFGTQYLANLRDFKVDVSHVRRDDNSATGTAFILVEKRGENSIVLAPGANDSMSASDVESASDIIADAAVLLVQLEIPLQTVSHALAIARQRGTTTILNPAPAACISPQTISNVDSVVLNESEADLLTGLPVNTLQDAARAGEAVRDLGVGAAILTLGDRGALYVDAHGEFHASAHAVDAVDTTAAGDAFVGAFAVAKAEGMGPDKALRFANAAGAVTVTREGAQPSLPDRRAVRALLAERRVTARGSRGG